MALIMLAASLWMAAAVIAPAPLSETEMAQRRMRAFARRVEKLARESSVQSGEELRDLIAAEVRRMRGAVVLAGLREDPAPQRYVAMRNGTAVIASFPVTVAGQRVTLRLATLLDAPATVPAPGKILV